MKQYRAKRVNLHEYHPLWCDTNDRTLDWKRCKDKEGLEVSFPTLQEAQAYIAAEQQTDNSKAISEQ